MAHAISKYFSLLKKWNRSIRLVSAAESEDEFREKHVRDVEELLPFLAGTNTMIDIGTGAGLPGILIKIARPEIEVVLLDSIRKKISFCDEAIRSLGLTGIRAVVGRAEDEGVRSDLGTFDAVISRATWNLANYVKISSCYMDRGRGSRLIALKGALWREELADAKNTIDKQGLTLDNAHEYTLSDGLKRCILSFKRRCKS